MVGFDTFDTILAPKLEAKLKLQNAFDGVDGKLLADILPDLARYIHGNAPERKFVVPVDIDFEPTTAAGVDPDAKTLALDSQRGVQCERKPSFPTHQPEGPSRDLAAVETHVAGAVGVDSGPRIEARDAERTVVDRAPSEIVSTIEPTERKVEPVRSTPPLVIDNGGSQLCFAL
jgi:hypothetical protein